MSGIARILLALGVPVSGSDAKDSRRVHALRALGHPARRPARAFAIGRDHRVFEHALRFQGIEHLAGVGPAIGGKMVAVGVPIPLEIVVAARAKDHVAPVAAINLVIACAAPRVAA